MKRTITCGYKALVALSAFIAFTFISSCREPKPTPNPNPNPGNTEDPNKNPEKPPVNPEKGEFKEWLALDNEGNLTAVPIPFADFTKGIEEVKAWEKEHGSTLYNEKKDNKSVALFFNTNDPKKLNEKRFYTITSGKLVNAAFSIASKLVFESSFSSLTPSDSFEALLQKEGYTKIDDPKKQSLIYTNGKYNLTYSYNSKNKNIALGMVFPASGQAGKYAFHKDIKDLPLLLGDKWIKDYGEKAIKEYEAKVGRLYSEKSSQADTQLVFLADASIKTNFQEVKYDLKDRGDMKAEIICKSLSIPNIAMVKTPEGEQYLKAQGFVFEKEASIGQLKAYTFIANDLGFRLTIAQFDKKTTMWVFDKIAIKGGKQPAPTEKRKDYYLPLYMWDAPISADSPLIAAEKKRGMEKVTFRPGETEGTYPRPAEITAEPVWDIDYSSSRAKKLGISSITYQEDKYASHPTNKLKAIWNLNYFSKKELRDKGIQTAIAFLEENGFVKKEGNGKDNEITEYYNAKDKVAARISRLFGDCSITFTYSEQ